MKFLPFYLSLAEQNQLVSSVGITNTGIGERRKIIGFALGEAIGTYLPIEFTSEQEADLKFSKEYRTSLEDAIAMFNEFMILERNCALDIAKGVYMYRTVMANTDALQANWAGLHATIRNFIPEDDMAFYEKNACAISNFSRSFRALFNERLKEIAERAAKDLNSGY